MTANPLWVLTIASMKMWIRNRQALFWSIFLPVVIMGIFGMLNFGALGQVNLGIVDQANSLYSRQLVDQLRNIPVLKITESDTIDHEHEALLDGERDLILLLPTEFESSLELVTVHIFYNEGRRQQAEVGQTSVHRVLDKMTLAAHGVPRIFSVESQAITDREFRYIDFLVPGVVAMAIMQMGLFSVAFAFVQLKQRGIIRRLMATPLRPASFLFAQIMTRLSVCLLQVVVLMGMGMLLFDVKIVGNLGSMLLVAILGGSVFISIGFAVSGWASSEQVAGPLANVIAMPMMFLSGVFFPRDVMPPVLNAVTDYLPLTYFTDALRNIAINGSSLWSEWPNLIGLLVWLVISFMISLRLFRWE